MNLWQKMGIATAVYFALASIEMVDRWSVESVFRMIAVISLLLAIPPKKKEGER